MNFAIRKKVLTTFVVMLVVISAMATISFTHIRRISASLAQLVSVEDARQDALVELKIKVREAARQVGAYVENQSTEARAKAAQHRSAFKTALSDFIALTENEIHQKMLAEVGGKFEELGRLADGIMDLTVAQGSDLGELNITLSEVSRILEGEIQKVLGNSSQSAIEKQWATLELGLSVNDVVSAMEEYIDAPAPNLRENMQIGVMRFEKFLEAFRNSDPSEMESVLIGQLEEQFDSVKSLGLDLMNGADRLRRKLTILDDKKTELDGLVESTLRGALDPEKAKGLKIEAVLEMEINIHQTYSAFQRFVVGGSPELSQEIADAFFEFKRYETNYRKFSLSPSEKEELRSVVGAFSDLHAVGLEVMEEIEVLNLDSSVLLSEVSKLDDVLSSREGQRYCSFCSGETCGSP